MINPSEITNFSRTQYELEEFLLFAISVAGKQATMQAKKLDIFLSLLEKEYSKKWLYFSPFKALSYLDHITVMECLKESKIGQYNRLRTAFKIVCEYDPSTVSVEHLESIKGIGPKTARFFLLHSRKDQNIACLDTHILSWLRENGVPTPKSTPPIKRYKEIEIEFLKKAKESGMSVADFDLKIWKERSKK